MNIDKFFLKRIGTNDKGPRKIINNGRHGGEWERIDISGYQNTTLGHNARKGIQDDEFYLLIFWRLVEFHISL